MEKEADGNNVKTITTVTVLERAYVVAAPYISIGNAIKLWSLNLVEPIVSTIEADSRKDFPNRYTEVDCKTGTV